MQILMLGANHRTAPVELRERLSLAGDRLDEAFQLVRGRYPHVELVILSTCNRTELYLARPELEQPSIEDLRAAMSTLCGLDDATLQDITINLKQDEAVTHLFRVAAGLDSMIVGEPQILGQVKRAYDSANQRHAVGPVLHRVFQQAIATAKQVRTETGLAQRRASVGSAAVDFARRIFSHFEDKTVVAIGAGEMAKVTLQHLRQLNPARLWIVNRSPQRAQHLAEALKLTDPHTSGPRPWSELDQLLVEADIVVTSTGATEPIITAEQFKPLVRRRRSRPLFMIDIALPRDVEPAVGSLNNVYLYNLDDLQQVVAQSLGEFDEKLATCEAAVAEAVRACVSQIQTQDIGQLIATLRNVMHEMGRAEQQRAIAKLSHLPPDELAQRIDQVLEEHTRRLVNKILHLPLSRLDRRNADAPLGFTAAALRYLFKLDEYMAESQSEPAADTEPTPRAAQRTCPNTKTPPPFPKSIHVKA